MTVFGNFLRKLWKAWQASSCSFYLCAWCFSKVGGGGWGHRVYSIITCCGARVKVKAQGTTLLDRPFSQGRSEVQLRTRVWAVKSQKRLCQRVGGARTLLFSMGRKKYPEFHNPLRILTTVRLKKLKTRMESIRMWMFFNRRGKWLIKSKHQHCILQ